MTALSPILMAPSSTEFEPISTLSPMIGQSAGPFFMPIVVQCRSAQLRAEDRGFVHDQPGPMVKSQPRTDLGLQIEFDSKTPFHVEHVEGHDRSSQPAKRRSQSLNSLGGTVKEHRAAALPIPGVCPPILKDPGFHLPSRSLMEVHFYLPERYLPDSDRQEAWRSGKITRLEEGGKIACAQCWIFQTWLALERSGFPARLTHSMPSDGVLVTLTNCVGRDFRPPDRVFFVGIVADYLAHPHAHLHVVQNAAHVRRLWNAAFIPLWPHPNLIPRDPARSDRFENVCFFGDRSNLARGTGRQTVADGSSRTNWASTLSSAARIAGTTTARPTAWLPCAGSDALTYLHKPATKLYNAWLAGVPFIGGMDSAYAADGEPGRNFLRASTRDELFRHIRRLKEEPALRDRLVAAGRIAGRNFTSEAILDRWKHFLSDTVQRFAERWQEKRAAARRVFFAVQSASVWLDSTAQALR